MLQNRGKYTYVSSVKSYTFTFEDFNSYFIMKLQVLIRVHEDE